MRYHLMACHTSLQLTPPLDDFAEWAVLQHTAQEREGSFQLRAVDAALPGFP